MTNKRIALYLAISMKTVEKHRANLMEKLNLHSAATLTHFAMQKGLIGGLLDAGDPVSTMVNSQRNNTPDVIEPVATSA